VRFARGVLKIIRPYSSLLAFLAILVPILARSNDLSLSLRRAIPLLFISSCTFIINDLYDIEKDKDNHPERPLPSGQLKPTVVASLYFICLAAALFTTRSFIGANHIAFFYYLLLTISISYGCVVEYLSSMKSIYVAGASSIPVLIIVAYYPSETALYKVAAAFFFFNLGRELCKDLLDRPGDPVSVLHKVQPERVATVAFASQVVGFIVLSLQTKGLLGALDFLAMIGLWALSYIYWFRLRQPKKATALMKAVMLLGLYFLV
jgi:geranylgeranylglycerol-phosphate geranylgeranyltransferase